MVYGCHSMKGNQEWRYNHSVSFRALSVDPDDQGEGGKKPQNMLDFTLGQISAYVNAAEQRGQVWVK